MGKEMISFDTLFPVWRKNDIMPEWLTHVEGEISRWLPSDRAKAWPKEFSDEITSGASFDQVKTQFLIFILWDNVSSLDQLSDRPCGPDVQKAIEESRKATIDVIACCRKGLGLMAAESVAWGVSASARAVARFASERDESAESEAWTAKAAATLAQSAAWAASREDVSVAMAMEASIARLTEAIIPRPTADRARAQAYVKYADKLIELIKGV